MLKSTSHRSIQHAKITKNINIKIKLKENIPFGLSFDKTHSLFSEIHKYTFFTTRLTY